MIELLQHHYNLSKENGVIFFAHCMIDCDSILALHGQKQRFLVYQKSATTILSFYIYYCTSNKQTRELSNNMLLQQHLS